MQSYIQYHKVVRFRHIISKKYLGFQEKKLDKGINNNNNELEKGKTIGNLILTDVPRDSCDWMLLESYQNYSRISHSMLNLQTKILDLIAE